MLESRSPELRGELLRVIERSGPDGSEEEEGVVSKVGEERTEERGGESGRSEGRVDDSVDEVGEVNDLLGGGRLGKKEERKKEVSTRSKGRRRGEKRLTWDVASNQTIGEEVLIV